MSNILFYEEDFYEFSNFSPHAVKYDGKLYSTSEHAYQAAKFDDDAIKEEVRSAKSPLTAKHIANDVYKAERKENWDDIKVEIMYAIVKAKLLQHPEVQDALMRSAGNEIIENSPVDLFWGYGKDKNGQNHLGEIWMKLRKEVNEGTITL